MFSAHRFQLQRMHRHKPLHCSVLRIHLLLRKQTGRGALRHPARQQWMRRRVRQLCSVRVTRHAWLTRPWPSSNHQVHGRYRLRKHRPLPCSAALDTAEIHRCGSELVRLVHDDRVCDQPAERIALQAMHQIAQDWTSVARCVGSNAPSGVAKTSSPGNNNSERMLSMCAVLQ
jgi:hypothetical protein